MKNNQKSKANQQKNIWKWSALALLLVVLVAGATLLYGKLGDQYKPNNLMTNEGIGGGNQTPATEDTQPDQGNDEHDHEHTESNAAPDFTVVDGEGKTVKLSDFKGKPVVLNFWATWCGYCVAEMPDFDAASEKYPDVQFMMVNATDGVQETIEKAKAFVKEQGFSFDVFYDTAMQAVSAYGVSSFPITYFIDANGDLVAWGNGMLDMESLETGIGMILSK